MSKIRMMGETRDVLANPRSFFENEIEEPSVRTPVLIVASLAVLGVLSAIVTYVELIGVMTGEARTVFAILQMFNVIVAAVAPFFIWILYAGVFYVMSIPLGGEGSFRNVILLSAWGFIPRIAEGLLTLVATIVALQLLEFNTVATQEEFSQVIQEIGFHTAALTANAIGIGLLLVSAYIWVGAMETARNLTRRNAVITVAVPVLLALAFRMLFPLLA